MPPVSADNPGQSGSRLNRYRVSGRGSRMRTGKKQDKAAIRTFVLMLPWQKLCVSFALARPRKDFFS